MATERARLAGELHDMVGHRLALIVLQLVAVDGRLDQGDLEAARRQLATLENTARQTLAETRRLVHVMDAEGDADLSPQPGLADVPSLVEDVTRAGADVELLLSGCNAAVSPGLGLTVYRVVQEALTNVVRHAQPARATVVLHAEPDLLTVEVSDQGTGRQPKAPTDTVCSGCENGYGSMAGRSRPGRDPTAASACAPHSRCRKRCRDSRRRRRRNAGP